MLNWVNNSVFYHIYPLGAFGAPRHNDFVSEPVPRLDSMYDLIAHLERLGVNAVYLGPLFESDAHGYDTADYFSVDRRLGTNDTLAAVIRHCHDKGIRVILDGVFNHVGRNFWAFRDVIEKGEGSPFKCWFDGLDFSQRSPYGDRFSYKSWNGNYDLVKLNLHNDEVVRHLLAAVEMWIGEFAIDGLRLDVADCLSFEFMQRLSVFCKSLRQDFWLMGEVVHGDYRRWANPATLDSVTNYECYKGLYSSHVDKNFFEIAWALNRQFGNSGIYKGLNLYNFVDNHDVSRIISSLTQARHLYTVYLLLLTMPGVPSIYYGSESGIEGKKGSGDDWHLRPQFNWREMAVPSSCADLIDFLARLIALRKTSGALKYGDYQQLYVNNEQFAFMRSTEHERIVVMVNSGECSAFIEFPVVVPDGEYFDVLNNASVKVFNGKLACEIFPGSGRIIAF
jgi:glycosidase